MAISWAVTGQAADQLQVNTAGQPVSGHVVYFITGRGQRGSVFVPDDNYSAAHVKAAIQIAAAQLDEVAQLAEGMPAAIT